MNPAMLGFARALGVTVLLAGLTYVGNAAHLSGIMSDSLAILVSGLALSIEHMIEARSGKALFGAVRTK